MKQKDLVKRLHISTSYMSQLENNTFDIRFGLLLEIANILKVEVDDLYEKKLMIYMKNRINSKKEG